MIDPHGHGIREQVVSASRDYFREANRGVIEDTRTRVVADDARYFLRGSGERFDVIAGDLLVPWRQGEGSLFTLEQITAARQALAKAAQERLRNLLPEKAFRRLFESILLRLFSERFVAIFLLVRRQMVREKNIVVH